MFLLSFTCFLSSRLSFPKTVPGSHTSKSLPQKILFDLKYQFCRANRELFETAGSMARRNHYVEAMQFRKHV